MTTKPRRKATPKVPAKPTPIEATQVLAYRGQLGEMGAETNHRDTLDLIGNMIDNSGGSGYRGNRGSYSNPGYNDRAYYERMERQRAYEEQMQWRRLQQQRQWEQQRYYGGRGCYRC